MENEIIIIIHSTKVVTAQGKYLQVDSISWLRWKITLLVNKMYCKNVYSISSGTLIPTTWQAPCLSHHTHFTDTHFLHVVPVSVDYICGTRLLCIPHLLPLLSCTSPSLPSLLLIIIIGGTHTEMTHSVQVFVYLTIKLQSLGERNLHACSNWNFNMGFAVFFSRLYIYEVIIISGNNN